LEIGDTADWKSALQAKRLSAIGIGFDGGAGFGYGLPSIFNWKFEFILLLP
jgi:hypothetical protein